MDLHSEIHWFEVQYELHKNLLPKGNVFGTFQGLSDSPSSSGDNKGNDNDNSSKEKHKVKCICGMEHLFKNCPYVNPAVQPAHWTPDTDMQAKFENI